MTLAPSVCADRIAGYAMNRFEPAEHGSAWLVADSLDFRGGLRPGLGVVTEWSWHPQIFHTQGQSRVLVRDQLFFHVGGALVFLSRFRFALDLPVVAGQSGGDVIDGADLYAAPARGFDPGDLRMSFDGALFGAYGDAIRGALGLRFWAPTGNNDSYTGDGKIRLAPHFTIAGDEDAVAWSITTELMYRSHRDRAFADTPIGSAVAIRGAVGVRFLERHLLFGPELLTSVDVTGGRGANASHRSCCSPVISRRGRFAPASASAAASDPLRGWRPSA